MRQQQLTAACMLWLSLGAGAASAQDADWQTNQQKGHTALEGGNLDQASDYLSKALASAEQQYGPNDSRLPALISDLADAAEAQKNYEQAEKLRKRVLDIYRPELGKSPDSADQMVKLAKVYEKEGKTADAEKMFEEALPVYERFHNANKDLFNDSIATVLNGLGSLYAGEGKFDKAEPLFQRSLSIRESLFGPNSLEVASTLNHYADLLRKTNRQTEGDQMASRAQTIKSQP